LALLGAGLVIAACGRAQVEVQYSLGRGIIFMQSQLSWAWLFVTLLAFAVIAYVVAPSF
jgi:hypothetical protein